MGRFQEEDLRVFAAHVVRLREAAREIRQIPGAGNAHAAQRVEAHAAAIVEDLGLHLDPVRVG